MHYRVSEERCDGREPAARQRFRVAGIACRDERKCHLQPGAAVLGKSGEQHVHRNKQCEHRQHAARHVEDRLLSAHDGSFRQG